MTLITTLQHFYVIYDSSNANSIMGLLDDSLDKAAHDALNPANIRTSTNKITSPDGEVLYLHELQVNAEGLASKV